MGIFKSTVTALKFQKEPIKKILKYPRKHNYCTGLHLAKKALQKGHNLQDTQTFKYNYPES